jgi:hypothetical protein
MQQYRNKAEDVREEAVCHGDWAREEIATVWGMD